MGAEQTNHEDLYIYNCEFADVAIIISLVESGH